VKVGVKAGPEPRTAGKTTARSRGSSPPMSAVFWIRQFSRLNRPIRLVRRRRSLPVLAGLRASIPALDRCLQCQTTVGLAG
jgi:hypothetical protein